MIFNEIFSSYYNVMAKLIDLSIRGELTREKIVDISNREAFSESFLEILSKIEHEDWQLIKRDLSTPIKSRPTMPLTLLQKRWLKSITLDPRFRLFDIEIKGLDDIQPLFTTEDYYVFDRYEDGDPYEDPAYIENFRVVLSAIRQKLPVGILYVSRRGVEKNIVCRPVGLEYSSKDDKFRVVLDDSGVGQFNVQRIVRCGIIERKNIKTKTYVNDNTYDEVLIEVSERRNALERIMLEFAYHRKEAEKTDDNRYLVRIWYDRKDRREILIKLLSFGPVIKVLGPDSFVDEIKERLIRQKKCEL